MRTSRSASVRMSALCTRKGSSPSRKRRACRMPPPVSSRRARSSLIWMFSPKFWWFRRKSTICCPRWWMLRVMSSKPAACSFRSTRWRRGTPATGTSALGIRSVRGRRRVPSPAAKIMAFIGRFRFLMGNSGGCPVRDGAGRPPRQRCRAGVGPGVGRHTPSGAALRCIRKKHKGW